MKNIILATVVSMLPMMAYAHEVKEKSVWVSLLVAGFPILIVLFVMWIIVRSLIKSGKNMNEQILESNLEIAKEIRRVADHLDKNS